MVSGEITVTGKNHIELELAGRPHHVEVFFKDDNVVVPCNPTHFDELEWFIREREDHEMHMHPKFRSRKFFLEISWNVSASREIVWHVKY